ncbi:helix-turn-helix domain-containing protein [Lysinibacillus xylanilyticus]|uniref:helix-turn-helix domain-containing protein n=1 Tax=Lysinibacillus xylanilyticus TaxID=582475 RepID=UPI0037F24D89
MPRKNNSYTIDFILEVVQAYLADNESYITIAKRFGVQNKTRAERWVKKFKEVCTIEASIVYHNHALERKVYRIH